MTSRRKRRRRMDAYAALLASYPIRSDEKRYSYRVLPITERVEVTPLAPPLETVAKKLWLARSDGTFSLLATIPATQPTYTDNGTRIAEEVNGVND